MGKLYLIPTPVGNMEDITLRALRLLKEVDLVLAEDTRTSAKLLKHYEITTPLLSHHKFNEHQQVDRIAERLERGENIALIRQKKLSALAEENRTMIFYESPFRLVKALEQMAEVFGPTRHACVAREISKMFEEFKRGTLEELAGWYKQNGVKGEIVLIVAGKDYNLAEEEGLHIEIEEEE